MFNKHQMNFELKEWQFSDFIQVFIEYIIFLIKSKYLKIIYVRLG